MAEILKIDPEGPEKRELDKAVRVLRRGGVVAFPTDTVYGIGGDAFLEESIEKIYHIKRRKRRKPLVLFVGTKEELRGYVELLPKAGEKLIDSYLPGPLTLILRASDRAPTRLVFKGTIGVRIPDLPLVLSLLKRYGRPLATTSANLTKAEPSLSAAEVSSSLRGEVDLILDGGRSKSPTASTVLDISSHPPTLLRKGRISMLSLEKLMGHEIALGRRLSFNLLFVCTANLCRSPLAEGLLKKLMPDRLSRRVRVKSAGTAAFNGSPASQLAVEVGREVDIDISPHRSQAVNAKLLNDADLILVMEPPHRNRLLEWLPEAEDKIDFLKTVGRKPASQEETRLADPVGRPIDSYRKCVQEIENSLPGLIQWLKRRLN